MTFTKEYSMSRKLKKPDYDSEKIMKEYMDALVDAFGTPYDDRDVFEQDHVSLNEVAAEFGITAMKARKLLITAGVYSTETSREIQSLYASGKKIPEIQSILGLSRASVHSYLPYTKGSYNMTELSTNAERTKLYRKRKTALEKLQNMLRRCGYKESNVSADVENCSMEELEANLWTVLLLYQGYPFKTVKGLKFTYFIQGNEMLVDRKEKSITRATIDIALKCAVQSGCVFTGPKKLGTIGSSYLYSVFQRMGIIC